MSKVKQGWERLQGIQEYKGPKNVYTSNGSSIVDGRVTFDPSIRSLQDQALQRSNAMYGEVGDAFGRYINRLEGNEGALIQARVNPVLQARDSTLGRMRTSGGLRGLGGSSFLDQNLAGTSRDFARQEGDVRSIATQESINQQAGLLMNKIATQAQLNGESYQVAQQRMQNELAGMGLAQNQINQLMQSHEMFQQRRQTRFENERKNLHEFGMTAWKGFTNAWSGGGMGGGGGGDGGGGGAG